MILHPPPPDRHDPAPPRAFSRLRRGEVAALSVAAAAVFGLVGLRAVELPAPRPVEAGDRLRIELVHPTEPEIVAGPVMDVGELEDGFQGLPPPLPPLSGALWRAYDDWVGADRAHAPAPRPRPPAPEPYLSPPDPDWSAPARAVQRWFGFDAPRPDYQAERAARRARMEAIDRRMHQEWEARRRRWAERRDRWIERRLPEGDDRDRGWADGDGDELMAAADRGGDVFAPGAFTAWP